MARHIKLLTFDIYNTVIQLRGGHPAIQYAAVANQHGLSVDVKLLEQNYEKVWKYMKVQYPNYGIHQGLQSSEWWSELVERVFCSAGFAAEAHKLSSIAQDLYQGFQKPSAWDQCEGASDTLFNLRQSGLNLAVVSNFDERLEEILNSMDLLKYFDFIVTSVQAKHEKPAPEIFKYTLNKAGVDASEAAHVGDDLEADYFGAHRVGMHSFFFSHSKVLDDETFKKIEKGCIIEKLSELEGLVKSKNVLYV